MTEENKKVEQDEDQSELFEDVLNEQIISEDSEEKQRQLEEQRRKNKDAEEARKRREEQQKKDEEQAKAKSGQEKPDKEKEGSESEKPSTDDKKSEESLKKLGEQLTEFKKLHPDVELAELDKDNAFKQYISERLLGKKTFTQLYDEFLELKSSLSGKSKEEVIKNYQAKANSSSGSTSRANVTPTVEVYSEEELQKLEQKIPFMHPKEYAKISAKLDRSIEFHSKKKT